MRALAWASILASLLTLSPQYLHVVEQACAEKGRAPVFLAAIEWVLMLQICETRSYFVY